MSMNKSRRFYILSLVTLAVMSAYPLINGIRMAYISLTSGMLEPEQYAKYVVPYAAICLSLLFFAALLPIFQKLKRFVFPAGLITTYGVFFLVERFFESIQIRAAGMTRIDPATLTPDTGGLDVTADAWQAALCIVSPDMQGQSLAYASQDRFLYVLEDSTYKVHYYLISLLLITMVCGLVYSIAKMLRENDRSQMKPVFLRGISTAGIIGLCVFANTTAFFRQAEPIQTPLASVLTGMFFVVLGAAAGIYVGSYLLKKEKYLRIGVPVLVALCVTTLMYVGEAVMMQGNLYRFGTGWFFSGLPGIALAPVDVLIILLSGAATWRILTAARKQEDWPGKRTVVAVISLCVAIAAAGSVIALITSQTSQSVSDDITGCYVFDENIYTNPLSSDFGFEQMPYVYGFDENRFMIANTQTGELQSYTIEYNKTPVGADEFLSKTDERLSFRRAPDLSEFKESYLIGVMSDGNSPQYRLYQIDGEIWLAKLNGSGVWSIYQLVETETTTLADLERAWTLHGGNPPSVPWPAFYENKMTWEEVYALARKGDALTLDDFAPFAYRFVGEDFTVRRYDVVYASAIFVRTSDDELESAVLQSNRRLVSAQVIDLREGFEAVTKYMDPLGSSTDMTIIGAYGGGNARELIYEYDYDQCRYYLNTKQADAIMVDFHDGERMPLKQALAERRITIEDAVSHGLPNVSMVPVHNPLGGEFMVLRGLYSFFLNDEAFYPSKSFMYVASEGDFSTYYSIDELSQILEAYGYSAEAKKMRMTIKPTDRIAIAGKDYARDTVLAEAGIKSNIRSIDSSVYSLSPVQFYTK